MTHYQPRSAKVQAEYEAFKNAKAVDAFVYESHEVVREFTHWLIIQNRFPYDNMVRINHLLISREPLTSPLQADTAVKTEFEAIIQELTDQHDYDALIQNFPKTTTVKTQFHVHLVKWHGTDG